MKLVEIKFEEAYIPTPEELAALKAAWIYGTQFEVDEDGKLPHWWTSYLVDHDKLPVVPYKIERAVWCSAPLGLDTNTAGRVPAFNQKINVMVPGLGLLLLDEVMACTDYCSDALYDKLREGWRIVAVCPQPDQRRPDYVLGRVKPQE